jgi:hypothetical protein
MRKAIPSSIQPELQLGTIDRRYRSLGVSLSASAVIGLSLVLSGPPLPFPGCLFRVITGLPCPSCGLTHAFIALGHGRVSEAFLDNIMSPLLFVTLIGILGVSVYESLAGRYLLQPLWARVKSKVLVGVLILAALSWTWNLFKHFTHFAG